MTLGEDIYIYLMTKMFNNAISSYLKNLIFFSNREIFIPAKCQFCLDSRNLIPANFKNLGDREILYPRN